MSMSPSAFFWAMLLTHVPFMILALCLVLGARRIRAHAERVAGALERKAAEAGGPHPPRGPRSPTNNGALG